MHVVLVHPEIPPNTGNIARTCAATGTVLHLVEPVGFSLSDRSLKRAGVDYWHLVTVRVHQSWDALTVALSDRAEWHYFTSQGGVRYDEAHYGPNDVLVFGQESLGLPASILDAHRDRWRVIPMKKSGVRSLNLSNAVAIAVYEALRQQSYPLSD